MIDRQPESTATVRHDVIIVGGGIQGATMLLEASRRGLSALLLERDDFGGATSASSLRILHGGLRYLQRLDLPRVFVSLRERRWFSRHFPDLVRPLSCLMPLYGQGLRRPWVMRGALGLNDILSVARNRGVPPPARLPASRVISREETAEMFPAARMRGLKGAAVWHDAMMTSSERMLMEILHWASSTGATALNYVEAVALEPAAGDDVVVVAVDRGTDGRLEFRAPVVLNCTGPWAAEVAELFGQEDPRPIPSALGFNLLLDRAPLAEAAVAVRPSDGGHTYFLVPWQGRILAGTYHVPWEDGPDRAMPKSGHVAHMIADLNAAVPALELDRGAVVRIFSGLIPTRHTTRDEPASRPRFVDHGRRGGLPGLYSVTGVKYTTARAVAERTLRRIFGRRDVVKNTGRPPPSSVASAVGEEASEKTWTALVEQESVLHLDDLLLRRTEWDPLRAAPAAAVSALARYHGWNQRREELELERFEDARAPLVASHHEGGRP